MFRHILLALGLFGPTFLHAQSLSFDGIISLGINDNHGGTAVGLVDATARIPITRQYPLSFELGTYLFALDGKRPHETYAAFAWEDSWRLGVVRPAYDQVLPSVFSRAAPYLAYERAEYTRAHATVEAMRRTAVPWGLSWQERFGSTDVAVSVHDAPKGDFRSASISFAYNGEGWQLAGAVEALTSREGTYDGLNAKIGVRADLGQAEFGLAYLRPEANGRPDALALDLTFPVSTRLDVMAFGEFSKDGSDDAFGIALDYGLRADTSLLFSATDGTGGGALHLTLERRF